MEVDNILSIVLLYLTRSERLRLREVSCALRGDLDVFPLNELGTCLRCGTHRRCFRTAVEDMPWYDLMWHPCVRTQKLRLALVGASGSMVVRVLDASWMVVLVPATGLVHGWSRVRDTLTLGLYVAVVLAVGPSSSLWIHI